MAQYAVHGCVYIADARDNAPTKTIDFVPDEAQNARDAATQALHSAYPQTHGTWVRDLRVKTEMVRGNFVLHVTGVAKACVRETLFYTLDAPSKALAHEYVAAEHHVIKWGHDFFIEPLTADNLEHESVRP